MKKARLVAGVTAAIPVATGGLTVPAAAHTTQVTAAPAQQALGQGKTVRHHAIGPDTYGIAWYPLSATETLYYRHGGSTRLPAGYSVFVTCYYKGTTGYASDPYWDHVSGYRDQHSYVSAIGHIADAHVDMGGKTPPDNGIPPC